MGQSIDRKLCFTAAALGAASRKELAAAFRRVNPATSFDLERAHKWLQGRARPRDTGLYEDWARLLDLGRSGTWIAACSLDEFIAALGARCSCAPQLLHERAEAFAGGSGHEPGQASELAGLYVCYSHAWSPYFRGRIIRGLLSIALSPPPRRLVGTYTEHLPTGPSVTDGPLVLAERAIHLDLRSPGGAHLLFCLFPASAPASLLAGLMCGATFIGPEAQPSVTRIVMVRLPGSAGLDDRTDAYLPEGASLAADLARLGLAVDEPERVELVLTSFLRDGAAGGIDQIATASYRALVELFDRQWIARSAVARSTQAG